jgi:hypothetical protein
MKTQDTTIYPHAPLHNVAAATPDTPCATGTPCQRCPIIANLCASEGLPDAFPPLPFSRQIGAGLECGMNRL